MFHTKEAGLFRKAVFLLLGYGFNTRWKEELQPYNTYLHQ